MRQSPNRLRPRFALLINGVANPAIRFRMSHDDPDDIDILVDDRVLGCFAITDDCVLEIRPEAENWRAVSLDELKHILLRVGELVRADDLPKSSGILECKSVTLDETDVRHRPLMRLGDLTGHADCLKRVQALFYSGQIPHKSAGTVFFIPDLRRARKLLSDAGFSRSPYSPAALIEPQTRCAVHLVEEPL